MILQPMTAVANTAAKLFDYDVNRQGARIQNPFDFPIYLSKTNPPTKDARSIYVPPSNGGDPGQYLYDALPYEEWWYITDGAGFFGAFTW